MSEVGCIEAMMSPRKKSSRSESDGGSHESEGETSAPVRVKPVSNDGSERSYAPLAEMQQGQQEMQQG